VNGVSHPALFPSGHVSVPAAAHQDPVEYRRGSKRRSARFIRCQRRFKI
jgi:hypothetical protein